MTRIFRQRQPNNTPLTCEEARELMFDFIDGELSARDTARLEAHLVDCEACRQELEERRAILKTIAEVPMNAPASLYPGVMALIDGVAQEPRRRLTASRILPWGTLAAAAAMVTLVVLHQGMFGLQDNLSADMAAPDAAAAYDGAADDRMLYSMSTAADATAADATAADAAAADTAAETGTAAGTAAAYKAAADTSANYPVSQYKLSGGTTSETTGRVLETTSISALTPLERNEAPAPSVTSAESSAYTELLEVLVNDGVQERTAMLICAEDALDGLFADVAELSENRVNTLIFDGESAVVEFTGYLTLLGRSGEDFEYYIPEDAEFDRYLVVLVDGNAEEAE